MVTTATTSSLVGVMVVVVAVVVAVVAVVVVERTMQTACDRRLLHKADIANNSINCGTVMMTQRWEGGCRVGAQQK